jgi:hypothetical protein
MNGGSKRSPPAAELVMRYRRGGQERGIAIHGGFLLDVAARGPAYVVAELGDGEGRPQISAVLFGDGRYLERARTGEPGLCRQATATELETGGRAARAA